MKLPKGIIHEIGRNPHKIMYQSVTDFMADEHRSYFPRRELMTPADLAEAVRTDELWVLCWHEITPIGFCKVYGPTLARVLELACDGVETIDVV